MLLTFLPYYYIFFTHSTRYIKILVFHLLHLNKRNHHWSPCLFPLFVTTASRLRRDISSFKSMSAFKTAWERTIQKCHTRVARKLDHHARCISPWLSHSEAPADPSPLMCYFASGACDCLKAPLFQSFPNVGEGRGGGGGGGEDWGGVSLVAPCSASVFEVIKSLATAAAVERNW